MFGLTGEHRIQAGNASRTQLLNLSTGDWDPDLLAIFGIPEEALPRVCSSDLPTAAVAGIDGLPESTPVPAILADSHAALFAHGVREPGSKKVTYGTGSSVMGLLLPRATVDAGLVTTIASWDRGGRVLAFEGNILSTGATILRLAQVFGIDVIELDRLARSAGSAGGVTLFADFSGLGAPWWDENARAQLSGFELGTNQAQIARTAFDSVPQQVEDVLRFVDDTVLAPISTVLADGCPSRNDWLMQLQADLSQRTVERSDIAELSATGVAHLAGLVAGIRTDAGIVALPRKRLVFSPAMPVLEASRERDRWRAAIVSARSSTGEASVGVRPTKQSVPESHRSES